LTYLDSILPQWEMRSALLALLRHLLAFMLVQTSPDSASLFWSQIEGQVLLVLIEEAELRTLVCVDDCEDLGD
jgi:hypothetical protein